jgi:hypothetical protein
MNFKTKSYFLIPIIPNIRESFEVNSETQSLIIQRILGKAEEIKLEGLSIGISRGAGFKHILNLLFGSGNIELTGSAVNGIRILENIYNVKKFKDAIDGKSVVTSHQNEIANRTEFSENDLGNSIVYYPHIPKSIVEIIDYRAFRKHLRRKPVYRIEKKIGDLVYEGI